MTIAIDDATVIYPDGDGTLTALDRVSLTADAGTVTAITGASGSGKSTLLAVASTLLTPTSGTVTIDGRDVTGLSARERTAVRRDTIGIVFQQPSLVPSLTALDQLVATNELGGAKRPRRTVRDEAAALLDSVGLAGLEHRRPAHLSGGQRQRVNIARALMNDPSVLVVDEPTSALDRERGMQIIELLVGLTRDRGTATLLVTHDDRQLDLTDRVAHITDGALTWSRNDEALTAR
ncbi:ABC transporter ATP-binding protein [Solicola gregarius]|uniref:ABC transporter ATP-binding protein n=1 Tax=Solicola gregarius TaxID=2908642 RepID=A0AA46TIE0_9ACTN|nr:ABC transporter ATP-binding protein [Solicola gregarius]UYM05718.1 ABC transporter ATP-binding protein [Solicola gregarius]